MYFLGKVSSIEHFVKTISCTIWAKVSHLHKNTGYSIACLMSHQMVSISNLSKNYVSASGIPFTALDDINLAIQQGEFVAIVGKSGSGKSTLLNMLTGIDRPTSGEVVIGKQAIQTFSENQLARWRGQNVGIVFQFFQLIPTLTILENLLLAMDFVGKVPKNDRMNHAKNYLEQVGISEQAHKLPALLSGGQQQRAAIARALANDPAMIVADEPTGNLDSQNAASIIGLFKNLVTHGKTLILVTHDNEVAQQAQRFIRLSDGKIIENTTASAVR
jgi:putative ABC transport system ATP-binding protein